MTDPLFAGIDLGTTRLKIGIFDRRGVQQALRIMPHTRLDAGWQVTQDPARWWRAVGRGLRSVAAEVEVARIAAIAVCGQGPTLVTTDARLHPCGPALTWMDKRATAEATELAQHSGQPVQAGHLVAKALWLQRTDPNPRRRWHMQAWDYLAARLCGVPHTSATWFEHEIEASGLPREQFPPYVPPGQRVGTLTTAVARAFGLRPGIPVVAGTNDSIASCIGSGLTRKGRSVILGGTSGGFVLCWEPEPGAWAPPPGAYPEPPGCRYLGATISSSGLAVDWLASLFGLRDYGSWLASAAAAPPGADGLLFLPYLAGAFLPYTVDEGRALDDPGARGVFFGLGIHHGPAHLLRAVLEGVAYAVRQVYESTPAGQSNPESIITVGGQAHSLLWNQIKADVLGQPVLVPDVLEAGALGAASMAAAGSGAFTGLWSAAEAMIRPTTRLEPNPVAHARYSQLYYEVYRRLYPHLQDLFPYLPDRL